MRPNISWALAGNAIHAASQWLVFMILVAWLPLEDVGRFAYWIALTGPVFVLSNLRLRNLVATAVPTAHGFRDFLSTRLLTTAAAAGVSVLAASAMAAESQTFAVALLIVCARVSESVSDICHGRFQRELNLRNAAIGLITNGLSSIALVAAAMVVWPALPVAAAAYAAGSALALVAWDLPRLRRLADVWQPGVTARQTLLAARELVARALPLGLSAAVGSLQHNVPRYAVAAYLGPAPLAVFTALAYLPTVGSLAANAVAQAALPALARDLRTAPARFRWRLLRLVACGAALGGVGVAAAAAAGGPVLARIYGPAYAQHASTLLGLVTAAAISYAFLFLGTATTARRRFGAQFLTSCAGLLTVSVSVVPLIGWYGLPGAAGALIAGAFVEALIYIRLTLGDLRRPVPAASGPSGVPQPAPLVNCHG